MVGSNIAFAENLKMGSKGGEVKKAQEKLISRGYNVGRPDGIFGKNTKEAVIKFQRANGLVPDGVVGPSTKIALGMAPGRSMRLGDSGQDVRELQIALMKKECYVRGFGSSDGSFGKSTEAAVKNFQKSNFLNSDGIAGPETQKKLSSPFATTCQPHRKHSIGGNGKVEGLKQIMLSGLKPHNLPVIGKPNSVEVQYGENGKIARKRYYGPDGKAVKDEDYIEHGGHKTPHDHEWDWNKPSKDRRGDPKQHEEAEEAAKKAAVAAVAAAGGYVIYRGIRMLPSLLPPLWWTIPENVIIP